MSDQSPFSQHHQEDQFPAPQRPRWKAIVLVGFCVLFFLCSGFAGVTYFATQRLLGPHTDLRPPERSSESFANDASAFNQSLQELASVPYSSSSGRGQASSPELYDFVDQTLNDSLDGSDIPMNIELYIEAVGRSKWNTRPLSLMDRFYLREWLKQYIPAPESASENYRILQVQESDSPDFATADIYYYSSFGQAESYQWFLAKEDGEWSIYDWQRLEFGRRSSDEYAVYLRGSESLQSGADSAWIMAADASVLYDDGKQEAAERKLRRAERIRMLPEDKPTALLLIAYTWMSIDQYEEALRVLKSIPSPDDMWGVWPSIAVCHNTLGNYDACLAAIQKAEQQSPDHPNVYWLKSEVHYDMGNKELAAAAAIKALRLHPKDYSAAQNAIRSRRSADVPELLDILIDAEDDSIWRSLIYSASQDSDWAKSLTDHIGKRTDVPAGMHLILEGKLASANDDDDLAASKFVAAASAAEDAFLRATAMQAHIDIRSQNDKYEQLFAESKHAADLLADMFESAFDDELYADPQKLLDAIESNSDLPDGWSLQGLAGWCRFELRQYEGARASIETALKNLKQSNDVNGDEEDDYVIQTMEFMIVQSLLHEGQPIKALKRFPDNDDRKEQIANFLMDSNQPAVIRGFLDGTQSDERELVQLLRLRLLARDAFEAGDSVKCEELDLAVLNLASQYYEVDQVHRVREIVRQRAKHLAWSGNWQPAADVSFDFQEVNARSTHVKTFAEEAASLFDKKSLGECLESLANDPPENETLSHVHWHQFKMLERQGDWNAALEAIRLSIAKTEETERKWVLQSRRLALGNLLLRMGDTEAASTILQTASSADEDAVPVVATIQLAEGNLVAVRKSLQNIDSASVQDWLREPENINRLHQHHTATGYSELLNTYPIRIRSQSAHIWGNLYFESGTKIDTDFVERTLNQTWPESDFRIQNVNVNQDRSPTHHAVVATSDSARIVFSWSTVEIDSDSVPAPLLSQFQSPVTQFSIQILDQESNATERVFLAAASASKEALAFKWHGNRMIWFGDNLNETLRWSDHLPVASPPLQGNLRAKHDATSDETFMDPDQWSQILKDAGGKCDVVATVFTRSTPEQIPAELVEIDLENYLMVVIPKSDSTINPMIQAGIKYYCWTHSVQLEEPTK